MNTHSTQWWKSFDYGGITISLIFHGALLYLAVKGINEFRHITGKEEEKVLASIDVSYESENSATEEVENTSPQESYSMKQTPIVAPKSSGPSSSNQNKRLLPTKLIQKKAMKTSQVSQSHARINPDAQVLLSASFSELEPNNKESDPHSESEPNEKEKGNALTLYEQDVITLISAHKEYPQQARIRGIEGKVSVSLKLTKSGALEKVALVSSDSPYLSDGIQSMIREAAPFPPIPDALQKEEFSLVIPLQFSLTRK